MGTPPRATPTPGPRGTPEPFDPTIDPTTPPPPEGDGIEINLPPSAIEGMSRGELRWWLKMFAGVDLPVSTADLYDVAERLQMLMEIGPKLGPIFSAMPFGAGAQFQGVYEDQVRQVATTLQRYGLEVIGASGPQAQQAFTIFSELMRPPTPQIAKIPTAGEFMSDFDQAFRTHIEGMREAGKISGEEAEFAYRELRSDFLNRYLAKLSEFAEAGESPFALREVTRGERGVAPGTTAGKALTAARGVGVEEPTRIHEEIAAVAPPEAGPAAGAGAQVQRRAVELREQVEDIGLGVPKEFTSLPRLMPAQFLGEEISAESIRLRYAGSLEGGGRGARPAPPGFVSAPRRV